MFRLLKFWLAETNKSTTLKGLGIRILHLRLAAESHLLDLRFQVTDPRKAKIFLDRNHPVYLIDQKTGKALPVPITKSGAMRQTTLKPEKGREYFMFFSNPGGLVASEDRMTLAVKEIRIQNISVEKIAVPLDVKDRETLQKQRIKAWQGVRETLRKEFEQCSLACKQDEACVERCRMRLVEAEKKEYERVVYGKE